MEIKSNEIQLIMSSLLLQKQALTEAGGAALSKTKLCDTLFAKLETFLGESNVKITSDSTNIATRE